MEINSAATSGFFSGSNTSEPSSDRAAIEGDFETFLTLLTAQMRNQDPLKPVESTEFISQLASFSAVEQQVKSNETLRSILSELSGEATLTGLASWIGREARMPTGADFDGSPIEIETTPSAVADSAVLAVYNDLDEIVSTQSVSPADRLISWDGVQDDLATAPDGNYRFSITYSYGDTPIAAVQGRVFVPITEVRIDNGTPILVTADGTEQPLSEVTGVREPGV